MKATATLAKALLAILPGIAVAALLALVLGPQPAQFPQASTQTLIEHDARMMAEAERMVAEQVAALSEGRECWTVTPQGVIPSTLLVRNAINGVDEGEGDTGVVREVTFDEGWELAEQGRVWVEGACA